MNINPFNIKPLSLFHKLDGRSWIILSALFLLLICLFKPQAKLPTRVYDWFIVLDITQSMNVRDVDQLDNNLSRLSFAKLSIRQSLRALPCGSTVSLGLFTERNTSAIMAPLEVCKHFSAIDEIAARIDWRMAWAADSFIAHGVFDAISQLEKSKKKINLAFITDGNQAPPGNPNYMPEFSSKPSVVNGTLFGIGGLTRSRIPKLDDKDNIIGYWELEDVQRYATFGMAKVQSALDMERHRDEGTHGRNAPHGKSPVEIAQANLSAVDEDNLKNLAKSTGLDYTHFISSDQLSKVMMSNKTATWRTAKTDLRPLFAFPAMLLILAFFLPPTFYNRLMQLTSKRKKS